jgi:putative Holliday junction resolvase
MEVSVSNSSPEQNRRRLMALDVGDVRIGVALCDPLGIVVRPYRVVHRRPESQAFAQIVEIAATEEAKGIIVGLPLNRYGEYTDQTRNVANFIDQLMLHIDLPIETWDERYTTVEAERLLREMGVRREKWKEQIDAVAATVILQDYLDAHTPHQSSLPPDFD